METTVKQPTEKNTKLTFEIVQDSTPLNPFKDHDGNAPLMYTSGRYAGKTDYSEGGILEAIQEAATDGKIIRHGEKILDIFRDEISNATVKELGKLCELFKLPYKQYTSRGYSQEDWAEVLIVLTPEFYETTGAPKENEQKDLEGAAQLFDHWAWGDVYGFKIYKETTCQCCGETKEEEIDSCYGFFGTDFLNNGMLDYFPEELHEKLKNFNTSDIKY